MNCQKCNKPFREEDLDLHLDQWLCHDCEEQIQAVEILRALDGKIISIYNIKDIKVAAFSEKQALFLLHENIKRNNTTKVGIIQ